MRILSSSAPAESRVGSPLIRSVRAGRFVAEPDDDRIIFDQSETPRLGVIAARRPAGEVEDFGGDGAADLWRVGGRNSAAAGAGLADTSLGHSELG